MRNKPDIVGDGKSGQPKENTYYSNPEGFRNPRKINLAGFNRPRKACDMWLYEKHSLGRAPSLEMIETTATKLLGQPRTVLEGAELVLGRRIDAREKDIMKIIGSAGSPEDKFALLLLQKEIEKLKKRKSSGKKG